MSGVDCAQKSMQLIILSTELIPLHFFWKIVVRLKNQIYKRVTKQESWLKPFEKEYDSYLSMT